MVESSGHWLIDASAIQLADGQFDLTATASDGTSTSDPSAPFNVTIDTMAPIGFSINQIDEDSGQSDSDAVTNDETLVVSGVSEPDSFVRLSETSLGLLGIVAADGGGVWSVNLTTTPLADGNHFFTAIATDVAGNETNATAPFVVVVDTQSPALPVITRIDDDTGASSSDGITHDNALIVRGTAEPHSVVTLSESELGVLGTATTDVAGDWEFNATATPLADGSYAFSIIAQDLAGNVSGSSAMFLVCDRYRRAANAIT